MSSRAKRKRREDYRWKQPPVECPHCGKLGPHFVPPSLGKPGYFYCQPPAGAPKP